MGKIHPGSTTFWNVLISCKDAIIIGFDLGAFDLVWSTHDKQLMAFTCIITSSPYLDYHPEGRAYDSGPEVTDQAAIKSQKEVIDFDFVNDRNLYKSIDSFTGESIYIRIYH